MKKSRVYFYLIIIGILFSSDSVFSWENYDRVIAVVNNKPIVESDVLHKFNQLQKQKNIQKNKFTYEMSRVLDQFIENALVQETAREQSILISDESVFSHIENLMGEYLKAKIKDNKKLQIIEPKVKVKLRKKLKNQEIDKDDGIDQYLNSFVEYIEKVQKIAFSDFFEEVVIQMRREQVMSIAIGVSPPSRKEALDWYNKNKNKVEKDFGFEVNIKHILIKPKAATFQEERNVNNKLTDLRNQVMKGESFEKLAVKYSEDPNSAQNGGDLGWVMIAELDPYFAGNVFRLTKPGQLSQVFKSGAGYHLVKFLGKRPVTFEKVERVIMYKLYTESQVDQYKNWVVKRKKISEITIYMKDYEKLPSKEKI